ncbi:MAG: hypothetical protein V1815_00450 [Candidatus Woesearchaeota archaeon]
MNSIGLTESEKNAEFYFHGTTRFYYERQIKIYGIYRHDELEHGNSVFVSTNFQTSKRFAEGRAKDWWCPRSTPIILKIKGNKVRERVHQHPVINDVCIDYLLPEEFEVLKTQ